MTILTNELANKINHKIQLFFINEFQNTEESVNNIDYSIFVMSVISEAFIGVMSPFLIKQTDNLFIDTLIDNFPDVVRASYEDWLDERKDSQ